MNSASLLFVLLSLSGLEQGRSDATNDTLNSDGLLARLGRRQPRVHDPSTVVKCKDEYWLFATGFGLNSWHSKDLVDWQSGPHVVTNIPAWIPSAAPGNRGYFWAPDVIQLSNIYFLYYSVSTFGKNTSAIGLATNPTLDPADTNYAWADRGIVVQSRATNDFNTIDPAVTLDLEGHLWLAFGSFWSGIKLVQLEPTTGRQLSADVPMYSLARHESIEAACIYPHARHYYLFLNWGACCRGVRSTYNIRVGRSEKITGPYRDKDGVDLLSGGGTLLVETTGPFIGPGHAGIFTHAGSEWFSCHFYDGTQEGRPTLAIRPLHWSPDGWPGLGLLSPK